MLPPYHALHNLVEYREMGESAKWLSHITVKFLDVGVVLERVLLHAAGLYLSLSLSLPPSSVPFVLLLLENAGKTFAFLPVSYLLKVAVRCPCLPQQVGICCPSSQEYFCVCGTTFLGVVPLQEEPKSGCGVD